MDDAVQQYRNTRSAREDLFHVGRCAVHFALDENDVRFCTKLAGKASVFLPFNRGNDDGGAGNPVNPNGLKTDYLWRDVLTPASLTDIIENYAQKVGDEQIWPRYHQLEVVRKLLQDAATEGVGKRYLIQHSAGSGKSHSIAWLSRQLIELAANGQPRFRLHPHHYGPHGAGQPDSREYSPVHAGGFHRRPRRNVGAPAAAHYRR